MLADQIVHTTGVNWESVTAIVAIVGIIQGMLFWLFARRDKKREDSAEKVRVLITEAMQEQTNALNHQTDMLLAKLETKETVAKISERLARVEGAAGIKNANSA